MAFPRGTGSRSPLPRWCTISGRWRREAAVFWSFLVVAAMASQVSASLAHVEFKMLSEDRRCREGTGVDPVKWRHLYHLARRVDDKFAVYSVVT